MAGILETIRSRASNDPVAQYIFDTYRGAGGLLSDIAQSPQAQYFAGQFAPGAGSLDFSGQMPLAPTGEQSLMDVYAAPDRLPSFKQNLSQGNYFDAVLQGLGATGDYASAIPVLGTVLKAPRAIQKTLKAAREGKVISERFPTGKNQSIDPLKEFLSVDINTLKTDEKLKEKVAEKFSKYPNYASINKSPDYVIDAMKDHSIQNLQYIYDQLPAEVRERASKWYDGGNRIANEFGSKYKISNESAAGVIAALSPQKDWYRNISLADRVLDISKNKNNIPFDNDMYKQGLQRLSGNEDYIKILKNIKNKTFSELTDSTEKAVWLRMYDETVNPSSYHIYSPEGQKLEEVKTKSGQLGKISWGSFGEISKAIKISEDAGVDEISRTISKAHKVRNFYNNIIAPSNPSSVTIDTHAVAAALMRPLGGSSAEVIDNLRGPPKSASTGLTGTYPVYADAYREFASQNNILPRQGQSITWEAVRGLFSDVDKRDKGLLDSVNKILSEYNANKITQRGMQDAILNEARGVALPDWYR